MNVKIKSRRQNCLELNTLPYFQTLQQTYLIKAMAMSGLVHSVIEMSYCTLTNIKKFDLGIFWKLGSFAQQLMS